MHCTFAATRDLGTDDLCLSSLVKYSHASLPDSHVYETREGERFSISGSTGCSLSSGTQRQKVGSGATAKLISPP
jgi:hypothetical protein